MSAQPQLLSGDEAIALAALHAGVRLGTGYPGTPSTEILEAFDKLGGRAQWSPNEKVALEVGLGAAFGGARTLVTMKHVGLNVAADPLFTAAYTDLEAGLVVVSADDPGMASSQNEQDNRHYARAAALPMLEPMDSQQAYDLTLLAFDISERWRIPVILRITTRVCHSKTIVRPRAPQPAGARGRLPPRRPGAGHDPRLCQAGPPPAAPQARRDRRLERRRGSQPGLRRRARVRRGPGHHRHRHRRGPRPRGGPAGAPADHRSDLPAAPGDHPRLRRQLRAPGGPGGGRPGPARGPAWPPASRRRASRRCTASAN